MVNTLANADNHKNKIALSSTESTVISIKQLPDELLLHIFSFLQAFDLLAVELICHRWKNLATDEILWKNLYQKHFEIYGPDEGPYKESYFAAHRVEQRNKKIDEIFRSLKHVHNLELAKYIGLP
ncbi:F-box-like domain-containing protein [Neochlamydia sp. S13]|uniref:F-box-like domain-containing protein n=1 Tax=Neochlamydia sp. S13 TaxID=1353976 RepID=UPI0005A73F40|nr:F-box protein [Neochlamydia sp. S13]BBI16246.1 F-box only protein 11 [Neochlamydia sp. S13]